MLCLTDYLGFCFADALEVFGHSATLCTLGKKALCVHLAEYFHFFPCRFIARLGRNAISVYEAPDMVLLDKRSLKLEGVQDFEWSPKDDILCAYQSEQAGGNLPARISLIKLPERTELRQKNLFSVSGKCPLPLPCLSSHINIPECWLSG